MLASGFLFQQTSLGKLLLEINIWNRLSEFQRKQITIHVQVDHAVGYLVVEQVEATRLVTQFEAVHAGTAHAMAKKGMAMVISADQQIDAGLAVLVAVPVIDPMVGHLQDSKLGNRAQLLDSLQGWLSGDPGAAQGCGQETEMGKPELLFTSHQLPAMLQQRTGMLTHRYVTIGSHWCDHADSKEVSDQLQQ